MTKKLYYKGSIASTADYMKRKFGVRFCEKPDGANELFTQPDCKYFLDGDGKRYKKAYVHPDSYDIFKPRDGDTAVYDIKNWKGPDSEAVFKEITERKGRPFFWPMEQK